MLLMQKVKKDKAKNQKLKNKKMSKYNLKDIYEGMSDKEFNDAKESDRLEKHPERDTIKKIQALIAKEKSLEEDETSVNLAIEASQEKAGIEEGEGYKKYEDGVEKAKLKKDGELKEFKNFDEDVQEIKMHLKTYRDGIIDGDDLANAVEEIVFGEVPPPGERGFNTKYGMEEAKAIPTEPGITKIGDDGKEYGVRASNHDRKMAMRSVIDILRDELGVNTDGAIGYIRTHKDDLFDGTVDAYNKDEVVADFKEYDSVNRDSVDEMQSLKEYFNRFM